MGPIFFYTGILSKNVAPSDIKAALPQMIAEQYSAVASTHREADPENIGIAEYAYVSAEPNCWMVHTRWYVKPE